MRYITAEMLAEKQACQPQIELFAQLYPEGMDLQQLNIKQLLDSELDWNWATHLLNDTAQAEYDRVTATAWAEYDRVTATAWAEYYRICATALLALLKQD